MEFAATKKTKRRCRDILATAGYGIVVLVIWDLIKSVIYLNWSIPTILDVFDEAYVATYLIFTIIEFICCIALGLIIVKVGKGNKEVRLSKLIVSIVLLLFAAGCFVLDILTIIRDEELEIVIAVVFIEDIIFIFFSIRILVSIIRLRKLSKEPNNER